MAISATAFGTGAIPGASTVSAPAPASVALGDLLLIYVADATSTVTFTVAGSTGWTTVGPTTGQNIAGVLFYKSADSTDVTLSSGSSSYTLTPSASHSAEGMIIHAPGCSFDPSAPATAGQYAANATGSSFAATGVTTTINGDTLMLLGVARSGSGTPSTITLASGFSALVAQSNSSAGAAANIGIILGTETQSTAGATGNQANTTAGNTNGGSFLFALSSSMTGSASLSGSGSLAAAPVLAETATLSGSGTLTAAEAIGWAATLSGTGTLGGTLTLVNNAEGGTNGTTVTTGNSGGTSGFPFDSIFIGGSAALAYDNTHAAHGTLAYKVSTGGSATTALSEWNSSVGTQTTIFYRMYCYIPSGELGVAAWRSFETRNSGGHAASVLFQTNGTIQLSAGTAFIAPVIFGYQAPVDQWFRVEGFFTGDPSAGVINMALFTSPDALIPVEVRTVTGQNTTGVLSQYWFGQSNSTANSGPFWYDDIGLSPLGFIGPVGGPAGITLQNSAEGAAGGTTVTTSNSGNSFAGPAFDVVNIGSLATLTFDTTYAAHGVAAYNFTVGSPAANSFLSWTNALTGPVARTQVWFRAYIYQTAYSTNVVRMISGRTGTTFQGGPGLNSAGKIVLLDASGSTIKTSTTVVPLNQWWRLEGYIIGDPSVGQVEVKIFTTNPDDTTPDETLTTTAAQNTGAPLNRIDFGNPSSQATYTFWMDEIGASTQGYMGPAGYEGALSGTGILSVSSETVGPFATLSGSGSLAATETRGVQATLSGSGTLSAFQGGTATLAGAGTLSAAGTQAAQGALGGTGSLGAGPVLADTPTMAGTGTLGASPIQAGAATLSGSGTLAALGTIGYQAAMSGLGTLLATGSFPRTSAMTGTGTLSATQAVQIAKATGTASVYPFATGIPGVILTVNGSTSVTPATTSAGSVT